MTKSIERIRVFKKRKPHSELTRQKIKAARARQSPPRPKGVIFFEEHKKKISDSKKGKPRFDIRGEKSNLWKGGVDKPNKRIRGSIEYSIWRRAVFERDNWICVWCGQVGGKLEADHIKPFAYYPELRFAIDNGRTLCKPCHLTTDTWGRKSKRID